MATQSLGIVLSGGGAKAAAHIGFLEVLSKNDIRPKSIYGVSAGALVAAMYAVGMNPKEMLRAFEENDILQWSYLGFPSSGGLIDSNSLLKLLETLFGETKVNEVDIDLGLHATNLLDGSPYYFVDEKISKAVVASGAFPGMISPIEHNGMLLSDGGIYNNLPVSRLRNRCQFIIASSVNSTELLEKNDLNSPVKVAQRALHLSTQRVLNDELELADFAVTYSMSGIKVFELDRSAEAYEIGINTAQNHIDQILNQLSL